MAQPTYDQELNSLRVELENARAEYARENHALRAGNRDSTTAAKVKEEAFRRALDSYFLFLLQGQGSPWGSTMVVREYREQTLRDARNRPRTNSAGNAH
jgi:hypothetical protein